MHSALDRPNIIGMSDFGQPKFDPTSRSDTVPVSKADEADIMILKEFLLANWQHPLGACESADVVLRPCTWAKHTYLH